MSRYLDPKTDLVFKKIFGEHPHLLKSFLNAVLPLPDDGLINNLEYLLPEQTPAIPPLKRTIVDVKCTDTQGRIFIVEMQLEWTDSFMQRMLFGASQAYVKQLDKGEKYELLNPVYGLGIIGAIFDKESEDWYHHYKVVNVEKPHREIKGLQIIFLELPKFKPNTKRDKKLRILWLRFLAEINEKTKQIDPALLSVPEINEALQLTEEAGYSKTELEAYDKYWDSVSVEKTLLSGRYTEGLAEGRAKGLTEGRAEGLAEGGLATSLRITQNLLAKGFSTEEISQITGLSTEQIKSLSCRPNVSLIEA